MRRWISRFNAEGAAGLPGRPRSGRPRLGGRQLTSRIAALLQRPGPWTLPRIRQYLGRPRISGHTLYRRIRLVAIWSSGSYLMPASSDSRIPVAVNTATIAASRRYWNDRPPQARSSRARFFVGIAAGYAEL